MNISSKLKAIMVMTKPMQLMLLSITMYGAYFAAGGLPNLNALLLAVAAFGGIGGVTALNMVIENDIDSLMERTRSRPVPSGILGKGEAAVYSVLLTLIGVLAAGLINRYVAVAVLAGLFFDTIMYTDIAKRSTPLNILLGGVAGGMPALGGWAAARGAIDVGGLILSGIVMAWIPMHIWFISYYYKSDYARAGIPMAPVLMPVRDVVRLVKASLAVMVALAWAFAFTQGYGVLAALVVTLLSILAYARISRFAAEPSRTAARGIFKFASPIIAAVFLALPVDYWLIGRMVAAL
ncbi:heme o synthase [Stetteria hydrogenophila]